MSTTLDLTAELNKAGFLNVTKIANTLQGHLFKAFKKATNGNTNIVVIKVTDKYLHKNSISVVNNRKYVVNENIILESSFLQFITAQQAVPKSIIKFEDFFECDKNYYLVMEDGGSDMFRFVLKAHQFITSGLLDIAEWHKVARIIFKQMVESIEFIHAKGICHFDISLENYLINDVNIVVKQPPKVEFICDGIQVKLIDFGLSTIFQPGDGYKSSKWCGKCDYKSPEVASKKKSFNAKSNDIWCLGVVLFSLTLGCKPWTKAISGDAIFELIMNGNILSVLKRWNKMKYVNNDLIDLFNLFFQYEDDRICLEEIKQHPWLK